MQYGLASSLFGLLALQIGRIAFDQKAFSELMQ
jgi:hypothetical protein